MKRLLLILLTFMSLTSFAQLRVKEGSFRQIVGYVMPDREDHKDINDNPMALIKISTENISAESRSKFVFKGNGGTDLEWSFEPGEVYLYLTASQATFVEIIHDDYGKMEYWLPYELKDYCGYEMVVQYVPLAATPTQEPVKQIKPLVIKSDQPNASIFIDDEPDDDGVKNVIVGTTHTYRIECNMYHPESGSVTVNEKTVVEKTLRPNFGYISVSTSPEQGAKVMVNGEYVGLSPVKTGKLKSGTYNVKVVKEMYRVVEKTVVVNDGQTTNAALNMSANFVNVTVTADAGSEIYVDEEFKGNGKWTGRLSDGIHVFEARKTNHESSKKNVELVMGETKTISLDAPKPIYGSLDISSTPLEANIYIDGQYRGQTPDYFNEILVGTHELKLERHGCSPMIKTITIKKGEILTLNEKLQTGKEISISTGKSGDIIYIDGNYVGVSPLTANISYGTHNIKAIRDDQLISEMIEVSDVSSASLKIKFKQEINGHEYVDLGLSVKWATCNVGASSPEEFGDYYAWGETKTKSTYYSDNYAIARKSWPEISGNVQYDAAAANWGGTWRMPTRKELEELKNKCTWVWTTQNGVKGYKVKGPNGNSIFLPAAGWREGGNLYNVERNGLYWSSSPHEKTAYSAYYGICILTISDDGYDVYGDFRGHYRHEGASVRPVSK